MCTPIKLYFAQVANEKKNSRYIFRFIVICFDSIKCEKKIKKNAKTSYK